MALPSSITDGFPPEVRACICSKIGGAAHVDFGFERLNAHLLGSALLRQTSSLCRSFEGGDTSACIALCQATLDIVWEKLHTGYWKDVDLSWRYLYYSASCALALAHIAGAEGTACLDADRLRTAIKALDMGLLMGTPHEQCSVDARKLVSTLHGMLTAAAGPGLASFTVADDDRSCMRPELRARMYGHCCSATRAATVADCPSVESFYRDYVLTGCPLIIRGAIDHWPALSTRPWSLEYLSSVAGQRTVPIEVGSRYTDEEWTQSLMTIDEFISVYVIPQQRYQHLWRLSRQRPVRSHNDMDLQASAADSVALATTDTAGIKETSSAECSSMQAVPGNSPPPIGYLAQHQLFDQVPELKRDIVVPTYCCLGSADDVDVNAWFGPEGTVSPLHFDPKHNFLCQVVGCKYVRLYSQTETHRLYAHDEPLLFNTSRVDVESPDQEQFPLFTGAEYSEAVLRPGDMLYIPPSYWHFVRSLSLSFSVSFWWE